MGKIQGNYFLNDEVKESCLMFKSSAGPFEFELHKTNKVKRYRRLYLFSWDTTLRAKCKEFRNNRLPNVAQRSAVHKGITHFTTCLSQKFYVNYVT